MPVDYVKLRTNLRLAIHRLNLLCKKKSELSLKSRKDIADCLVANHADRASLRVSQIIRGDNEVEALEIIEMFCDLLIARFGLIEKFEKVDAGLDQAIATVLWAAPRISSQVPEFQKISDVLERKYGREYVNCCRTDQLKNVSDKVKKRMGIEMPPDFLVEQYLVEIAKAFNVSYTPKWQAGHSAINTEGVDSRASGSPFFDYGSYHYNGSTCNDSINK